MMAVAHCWAHSLVLFSVSCSLTHWTCISNSITRVPGWERECCPTQSFGVLCFVCHVASPSSTDLVDRASDWGLWWRCSGAGVGCCPFLCHSYCSGWAHLSLQVGHGQGSWGARKKGRAWTGALLHNLLLGTVFLKTLLPEEMDIFNNIK